MAAKSPLTDEHFEELKQRLADLDDADLLIAQSIRGGIDMTEQQKQSQELRDRLNKMRQAFWPGKA